MPSRKKIDRQKVLAYLNVNCPKCGRIIEPQEALAILTLEGQSDG
jgi:hypothetical protein